jgi:hypothetical protein
MIKSTTQCLLAFTGTRRVFAIEEIIIIGGFHKMRLVAIQFALHFFVSIGKVVASIDTILMGAVFFVEHLFLAILKKGIIDFVYTFIHTLFLAFHRTITVATYGLWQIMHKLAIILTTIGYPTGIHLLEKKKNHPFCFCFHSRSRLTRYTLVSSIIPIDSQIVSKEARWVLLRRTNVVIVVARA